MGERRVYIYGGKLWLANLKLINMENDKITIFFFLQIIDMVNDYWLIKKVILVMGPNENQYELATSIICKNIIK